jgi:hypothetical protein
MYLVTYSGMEEGQGAKLERRGVTCEVTTNTTLLLITHVRGSHSSSSSSSTSKKRSRKSGQLPRGIMGGIIVASAQFSSLARNWNPNGIVLIR